MVEFENRGISQTAIGASATREDLDYVSPRRGSPFLERPLGLPSMEITP
jgi:hypothetical protein